MMTTPKKKADVQDDDAAEEVAPEQHEIEPTGSVDGAGNWRPG